jgi:hypothetical protein
VDEEFVEAESLGAKGFRQRGRERERDALRARVRKQVPNGSSGLERMRLAE